MTGMLEAVMTCVFPQLLYPRRTSQTQTGTDTLRRKCYLPTREGAFFYYPDIYTNLQFWAVA